MQIFPKDHDRGADRCPRLLAISPGLGDPLGPWLRHLARATWPAVLLREPALTPAQVEDALQEANDLGFSQIWLHESCQIRDQTLQIPHTGRHLRAASPLPTRGPFGRSCHDEVELDACFAAGARYATLSPIWHPTSKPDDHRPEIGLFRLLTAARGRPVLALGGIDPSRLAQLARAGAWGAAILGPFRSAGPETTAAAQAMLGAWTESRPHPG